MSGESQVSRGSGAKSQPPLGNIVRCGHLTSSQGRARCNREGQADHGWVLTALAVSLGAPFWFDLLSRFVNIRSGGRPPKVEKDEDK